MELLRERFLKTYANIPLNLREDTILVFEDNDKIKKPISWNAIYVEVKINTELSKKLLTDLSDLKLI